MSPPGTLPVVWSQQCILPHILLHAPFLDTLWRELTPAVLLPAAADEFGAVLHTITPGSVFGAYLGESERRLRETFASAAAEAAAGKLVIVFLDEVDALCPRRGTGGSSNQHESRVVAQLLTLLDGAAAVERPAADGARTEAVQAGRVVVLAATNRPNALDPALRRPGRLDREVAISVPDAAQRADILRWGVGHVLQNHSCLWHLHVVLTVVHAAESA